MENKKLKKSRTADINGGKYTVYKASIQVHNNTSKQDYEFWVHSDNKKVTVIDDSCQLQKTYFIGNTYELENYEEGVLKSIDEIINLYTSGKIWF